MLSTQRRKKNKRVNKKRVIINSIEKSDENRKRCVQITTEDRKIINKIIDDAFLKGHIKNSSNVVGLKRLLAMLTFLNYKCLDKKGNLLWIDKVYNAPDEITDTTLEKLTGFNRKHVDTALALFEKLGIVKTKIYRGGTKIKVLIEYSHGGKQWINTEDYNIAGTNIRSYFRK